jgi:hypothetical protein
MSTPEGTVKLKIYRWINLNMPGLWGYSPRGGPFGKSGVPDRLNLWRGIFFAVEAKADHSCKPTELQWEQLRLIQRNGGIAAVSYGYEEHKLIQIRDLILERTPNFVDTNDIRGIPVSNESRLDGIFSSKGDVGFSPE